MKRETKDGHRIGSCKNVTTQYCTLFVKEKSSNISGTITSFAHKQGIVETGSATEYLEKETQ